MRNQILVNAVAPGPCETELLFEGKSPEAIKARGKEKTFFFRNEHEMGTTELLF